VPAPASPDSPLGTSVRGSGAKIHLCFVPLGPVGATRGGESSPCLRMRTTRCHGSANSSSWPGSRSFWPARTTTLALIGPGNASLHSHGRNQPVFGSTGAPFQRVTPRSACFGQHHRGRRAPAAIIQRSLRLDSRRLAGLVERRPNFASSVPCWPKQARIFNRG
jgi:hypothetical protein